MIHEKTKPMILSAEDDPDDQLLIKDAVEIINPSLRLKFVQNGIELLDYLDGCKNRLDAEGMPSLILLDLYMPLMDGIEALEGIKNEEFFKDLPVVVLGTSPDERERALCTRFGVDIVVKPTSFDEWVDSLKGVFLKWLK